MSLRKQVDERLAELRAELEKQLERMDTGTSQYSTRSRCGNLLPLHLCVPHFLVLGRAEVLSYDPAALAEGVRLRVCAKLVRSSIGQTDELVLTNFGLGADLRCLIPLNKTWYAFCKFEHMLAERATFALVRELAADCEEFV